MPLSVRPRAPPDGPRRCARRGSATSATEASDMTEACVIAAPYSQCLRRQDERRRRMMPNARRCEASGDGGVVGCNKETSRSGVFRGAIIRVVDQRIRFTQLPARLQNSIKGEDRGRPLGPKTPPCLSLTMLNPALWTLTAFLLDLLGMTGRK